MDGTTKNDNPIHENRPFPWTNRQNPISSIEKAFFKIELRRWDKNMVQVRHEMVQVRHDMVQVRHEMAQVRHEMAQVRYVSGAGAIFSC